MKKLIAIAATTFVALTPIQANSATGNIPFSGAVSNSCIITVGSSGALAASADYAVLSSEETGGAAGTATILTTGGGFSLSADAPASFSSAPATGNTNVSFSASYSATGANTIAPTNGASATALSRGSSAITVNMSGSKSVPGETFESGTYAATVVLRCE